MKQEYSQSDEPDEIKGVKDVAPVTFEGSNSLETARNLEDEVGSASQVAANTFLDQKLIGERRSSSKSESLSEQVRRNSMSMKSNSIKLTKPRRDSSSKNLNTSMMLNSVLGTEMIIENMLVALQLDEINDDEIEAWNMLDNDITTDTAPNLSFIKMQNTMLTRQARQLNEDGDIIPIPICSSRSGRHSSNPDSRKSDLEQLGPGIVLYLKMLKYFSFCFFMFFLMSLPSLIIFSSGHAFTNDHTQESGFIKLISSLSLGNMNAYEKLECGFTTLKSDENSQQMSFSCDKYHDGEGFTMQSLDTFGLAYQNQTCYGFGMDMRVQTIKRCSLNTMENNDMNNRIIQQFETDCIGKKTCELDIQMDQFFDSSCMTEIQSRIAGNIQYGPPKLFGIAQCEQEAIAGISRDTASLLVVILDLFIVLIFIIAIFRLRWYEKLFERDQQLSQPAIEDFSVYLSSIPVKPKDFKDNSDLLTAMMAVNLEQILIEKFMKQNGKDFDEAADIAQVSQIHYGLKQHHSMLHLVQIAKAVKKIAVLKKKIHYDPQRTHDYEEQMWSYFSKITKHKEQYYKLKALGPQNEIISAYITFRDIQARNKLLDLYKLTPIQSILKFFGFTKFFPKDMKLLKKGLYEFSLAVDPETVTWENLGTPTKERVTRAFSMYGSSILIIFVSFFGMWGIQLFEKLHRDWQFGDCSGNENTLMSQAYFDWQLPRFQKQGLMECYCEEQFQKWGPKSLDLVFEDNVKYCQEWYISYSFATYVNFFLCFYLAFCNWTLQLVFDKIGKQRKTKNQSENYVYRVVNIFVCQYFNTAILYLFAYHSFMADQRKKGENAYFQMLIGPFDEYSVRWYLVVGTPLVMTIFILGYLPNFTVAIQALQMFMKRFYDRQFTNNVRKTRQITQDEYEDMYTGPQFILQIRFSQILAQIFIALTFSSGMPLLYAITFVSFALTYWIDKTLLLRYYKKQNQFTGDMSNQVVKFLPWAVIAHFAVGMTMYTNPEILKTEVVPGYFGGGKESQYWNKDRIGQIHAIIFFWAAIFFILLLIFETYVMKVANCVKKAFDICLGKIAAKIRGKTYEPPEDDEIIDAPDLYYELDFLQLCRDFKDLKNQRLKFQKLRSSKKFDQNDITNYIDPYIQIIDRNAKDLLERIQELCDSHIERTPKYKPSMSGEDKLKAVKKMYESAIDPDNPNRDKIKLDDEMFGRVANNVKGYDIMDNQKYKDIEILLENLKENFDDDISEMSSSFRRASTFAKVSVLSNTKTMRQVPQVSRSPMLSDSFQQDSSYVDEPMSILENKGEASLENQDDPKEVQMTVIKEESILAEPKQSEKQSIMNLDELEKITQSVKKDMSNQRGSMQNQESQKTFDMGASFQSLMSNTNLIQQPQIKTEEEEVEVQKVSADTQAKKISTDENKTIDHPESSMLGNPIDLDINHQDEKTELSLITPDIIPPVKKVVPKKTIRKFNIPAKTLKMSPYGQHQSQKNHVPEQSMDSRDYAVAQILNDHKTFLKDEEKQIFSTKGKMINEVMSKTGQFIMNNATPINEIAHRAGGDLNKTSSVAFKPQNQTSVKFMKQTSGPKFQTLNMTGSNKNFAAGYTGSNFNISNFNQALENAKSQMMENRIKQTIKGIKNLHVSQNDQVQQQYIYGVSNTGSYDNLHQPGPYTKLPKNVKNMAKSSYALQTAMNKHLKLNKQLEEKNRKLLDELASRSSQNGSPVRGSIDV